MCRASSLIVRTALKIFRFQSCSMLFEITDQTCNMPQNNFSKASFSLRGTHSIQICLRVYNSSSLDALCYHVCSTALSFQFLSFLWFLQCLNQVLCYLFSLWFCWQLDWGKQVLSYITVKLRCPLTCHSFIYFLIWEEHIIIFFLTFEAVRMLGQIFFKIWKIYFQAFFFT
jgi:hypothetical protein